MRVLRGRLRAMCSTRHSGFLDENRHYFSLPGVEFACVVCAAEGIMRQTFLLVCVSWCACGPSGRDGHNGDDDADGNTCPRCSDDKMSVVDCNGHVTACPPEQGCSNGMCMAACEAAENNHASVGCDYYAVNMDAGNIPGD